MGRPIMPQTSAHARRTLTMMRRTATILLLAILTGAAWAQEPRMVPVTIDGEQVRLEMRVYETTAAGPAPTLVFNHGSTGRGTSPEVFTRPLDFPEVARFFVARGWAVVIPARRGPVDLRSRRALPTGNDLALWRRRPVLSPVTQPRELCRVPGGRRPRRVSRAAAGARRPLHLETAGSVGTARRGLPEAIGLAERRELGADARQPITRP